MSDETFYAINRVGDVRIDPASGHTQVWDSGRWSDVLPSVGLRQSIGYGTIAEAVNAIRKGLPE